MADQLFEYTEDRKPESIKQSTLIDSYRLGGTRNGKTTVMKHKLAADFETCVLFLACVIYIIYIMNLYSCLHLCGNFLYNSRICLQTWYAYHGKLIVE